MKYLVPLYAETITIIEIEADSFEDAGDMVLSGDYHDDDIVEVVVKNSEILT